MAAHQFINDEMSLAGRKNVFIIGQCNGTNIINVTCNSTGSLLINNSMSIILSNLSWNHCGYETDEWGLELCRL